MLPLKLFLCGGGFGFGVGVDGWGNLDGWEDG